MLYVLSVQNNCFTFLKIYWIYRSVTVKFHGCVPMGTVTTERKH